MKCFFTFKKLFLSPVVSSFLRNIIEIGHSIRAEQGIKNRQPLYHGIAETSEHIDMPLEWTNIILEELNIKEFSWVTGSKGAHLLEKKGGKYIYKEKNGLKVALDTKITPELQEEGNLREIIRQIQDFRKKVGLKPSQTAEIYIETDAEIKEIINKNPNIQKLTSTKINFGKSGDKDIFRETIEKSGKSHTIQMSLK